jgi:CRISPR/Cas system CSM-associated protein Csm3 (group 7 of RAMP superfamily)
MGNIIINGTITTVGPLSISMPDGKDFDGFPIMARGIDEDGNAKKTGYLPATTLRGFLRRAVVTHDMKEAADAGNHYSLPKAYSELIGQDAASEQQAGDIDLLEIKKAREESPVLDLFGSGLGISSRLRVGHFLPSVNVLPEEYSGVRKDLGDTEGVVELLSEEDATSYYARETSNSRRASAEQLVTSLSRKISAAKRKNESVDELEKELEEAKKIAEKYKDDMGDMQVSSRTLVGYTAMPAELELSGRIVIMNAKDRDLEMIEFGLNCLSQSPVLGAQSARGCGEISGSFDVVIDGEIKKKITIGGYESAKIDVF